MTYKAEARECEVCEKHLDPDGTFLELEEVNGEGTIALFCDLQCLLAWKPEHKLEG